MNNRKILFASINGAVLLTGISIQLFFLNFPAAIGFGLALIWCLLYYSAPTHDILEKDGASELQQLLWTAANENVNEDFNRKLNVQFTVIRDWLRDRDRRILEAVVGEIKSAL